MTVNCMLRVLCVSVGLVCSAQAADSSSALPAGSKRPALQEVNKEVTLGYLRNKSGQIKFEGFPRVLLCNTSPSDRTLPVGILTQFTQLKEGSNVPLTGPIDEFASLGLDCYEELKLSFDGLVAMLERVKQGKQPGRPSTMHAKKDQERYNNVLTMARYLDLRNEPVMKALEGLADKN